MRDPVDFLQQIDGDRKLSLLLANVFEFDVERKVGSESPRLASKIPIEGIAGDFTGGMFYLCGAATSIRPVLYASSEGDAGIIATGLREALILIIGLPCWRDTLKYSENGNLDAMKTASYFLWRDMLKSRPTIGVEQSWVAESLHVALEAPSELTARLHAAVKSAGRDFAFIDETGEYDGLFGQFSPSRNMRWK